MYKLWSTSYRQQKCQNGVRDLGVAEAKAYLLLTARRFRSPKFIAIVKSWNVRIVEKDVKLHDAKLRVKKYQVHISEQQ